MEVSPIENAENQPSGSTLSVQQLIRSAVFGVFFFTAIFLTVLGTLYALSDNPDRSQLAYPILITNLGIILILGIYLLYRVWGTLFAKHLRISAPLLHRRFILIFSLAALTPAILVGGFSTSLISKNFNDLFGENVSNTLERADTVLNEYVLEKFQELGTDLEKGKTFIERNRPRFSDRISFAAHAERFRRNLKLDSMLVIDRSGQIYLNVGWPAALSKIELPTRYALDAMSETATNNFAALKQAENDALVAFTQLDGYEDLYLVGIRFLSVNDTGNVQGGLLTSISGIDEAERALDQYNADQARFRNTFLLTLIETALLILYAAISLGVVLANRIISPIGQMVETAEKIRGGDLKARVNVKGDWGEMSDLGSALNRMTRQLGTQREDLVREHNISERRRQFSEAVLSGVRAGVIGLSQEGRVTLMNASAERLLGRGSFDVLGYPVEQVLPEFAPAFFKARESVKGTTEDQIILNSDDGVRNLDLRVSSYEADVNDKGWVLTFDDMTRLVAAQRYSAWREVARRIAHEIKNPLTPILLSAERLKRKYQKHIELEPDVFENCTDTIIRQVSSLERMVNEFSSFARMPEPEFQSHDLKSILEHVIFAQGVAFPDVRFDLANNTGRDNLMISCDERLITQALTNVLKNAGESVSERVDLSGIGERDGLVETKIYLDDDRVVVGVTDNGKGWPVPDRHRLLEPYVTTRETGTGLGLAIVKRIAEDHDGALFLMERPDGNPGAHLEFILPLGDDLQTQDLPNTISLEEQLNEA